MRLTGQELKWRKEAPQILRKLADFHDCEYTAAQAYHAESGKGHALRRDDLNRRAQEIGESY